MSIPPTLLLADDSLTIQRVVSLTFADQPVRVVVAKDGQDAINRMSHERPDVVLADTNMPCVDGYELARWVRQQPQLSTVPVLLLAGVTDPVDEQRLHDSGANGVLEKPFEPSHVISRVKELLGIKAAPPAAAGRLVTSPDASSAPAPARWPSSGPRPVASGLEKKDAGAPPADARPVSRTEPTATPPVTPPGPPPAWGRSPEPDELVSPRGDDRDWLGGDTTESTGSAALAEQLGGSDEPFFDQADESPTTSRLDSDYPAPRGFGAPARPAPSASAADVFESLLAAEQGDAAAPVFQPAASVLTPEVLDDLAARVAERLRPRALAEDLQRGLGVGLREAVTETLRASMATEVRAAVAEAVQAAVNGTILGTVRGAVNEAVATAVPAAVDQQVGARVEQAVRATLEALAPSLQAVVREVVDGAVRQAVGDAVAGAVPAAVFDAVRGDDGGQVGAVVRETAERLITEEIARIRGRRAS